MRLIWGIGVAFLCLGSVARASLEAEIHAKLKQTGFSPQNYTVLITGLGYQNPRVYFEHNTKAMDRQRGVPVSVLRAPASLQKIQTTAAALEKLGPGYQFRTEIRRSGNDFCLIGGGDPVLTAAHLEILADQLRAAGYDQITGSLILDESRFHGIRPYSGDFESDFDSLTAGFIGALSIDENSAAIGVLPSGKRGTKAAVATSPPLYGTSVANGVTAGPRKTSFSGGLVPNAAGTRFDLTVSGNVYEKNKRWYWRKLNIGDPALMAGLSFLSFYTEDEGPLPKGKFTGQILRRRSAQDHPQCDRARSTELAVHYSVDLRQILRDMNQNSVNFIAEMILSGMGQGDHAIRGGTIRQWQLDCIGFTCDVPNEGAGSGLYRAKVMDAWFLRDIMASSVQYYGRAFVESLGIPGQGTRSWLKEFFHEDGEKLAADESVFAKTGYIRATYNFAGFGEKSGRAPFIFVFFFEGAPSSAKTLSIREAMQDVVRLAFEAS